MLRQCIGIPEHDALVFSYKLRELCFALNAAERENHLLSEELTQTVK